MKPEFMYEHIIEDDLSLDMKPTPKTNFSKKLFTNKLIMREFEKY